MGAVSLQLTQLLAESLAAWRLLAARVKQHLR